MYPMVSKKLTVPDAPMSCVAIASMIKAQPALCNQCRCSVKLDSYRPGPWPLTLSCKPIKSDMEGSTKSSAFLQEHVVNSTHVFARKL